MGVRVDEWMCKWVYGDVWMGIRVAGGCISLDSFWNINFVVFTNLKVWDITLSLYLLEK